VHNPSGPTGGAKPRVPSYFTLRPPPPVPFLFPHQATLFLSRHDPDLVHYLREPHHSNPSPRAVLALHGSPPPPARLSRDMAVRRPSSSTSIYVAPSRPTTPLLLPRDRRCLPCRPEAPTSVALATDFLRAVKLRLPASPRQDVAVVLCLTESLCLPVCGTTKPRRTPTMWTRIHSLIRGTPAGWRDWARGGARGSVGAQAREGRRRAPCSGGGRVGISVGAG
jgi:hypothetical protein